MKAAAVAILLFLPSAALTAGPVADFIQTAHNQVVQSQPAVQKALGTLKQLAAREADQPFGLPRTASVSVTSVDAADLLPTYEIDLLKLRAYQPDSDALQSLADTRRVFYVVVAPPAFSSVEVAQIENDEWVTFRIGRSNYAKLVATTIKNLELEPKDTILVEIPALQLRFIGFAAQEAVGETLKLASVADAPEFGIVKGVARPAKEILVSLIDAAKRHDGRPT